ncbi:MULTISPECIES: hypothetical protein [unclassified Bradyrhizobium]|uniref:hypothetical protein n=1 Tax=unclassified Bradyrhizobium TaxID=2631580 RepID=UPI002916328B|nr:MULTISPECIES: hypothetical protein [unclassified Bradyrhizobium]
MVANTFSTLRSSSSDGGSIEICSRLTSCFTHQKRVMCLIEIRQRLAGAGRLSNAPWSWADADLHLDPGLAARGQWLTLRHARPDLFCRIDGTRPSPDEIGGKNSGCCFSEIMLISGIPPRAEGRTRRHERGGGLRWT